MILADTSVWVEHFRRGLPSFAKALRNGGISIHSVVIGELACGNLAQRAETLAALRAIPRAASGTADECLEFLKIHNLHGRGIGWNDVQLLAGAILSSHMFWTLDKRLKRVAADLGVAHQHG